MDGLWMVVVESRTDFAKTDNAAFLIAVRRSPFTGHRLSRMLFLLAGQSYP